MAPVSDSIMALSGDKSSKEIEDWSNEVEEATFLKKDARFHARYILHASLNV